MKQECITVSFRIKERVFSFTHNNSLINIDVSFLSKYIWEPINERSYDTIHFLEVIYVLHAIDQILPERPIDKRRGIYVRIPVENVNKFNLIKIKLQALLFWMTNDTWEVEFYERGATLYIPMRLPFKYIGDTVALWSGGLDAAAGAYLQLYDNPRSQIILVGSGRDNRVFKNQRNLANQLKKIFPRRVEYIKIPVKFNGKFKNQYARTRGLVFMAIGLLVSNSIEINKLLVYENGIGALNEEIESNQFSNMSHSVHPKTLYDISDLFSSLVEHPFQIQNPFLFHTKAQMCREAISKNCTEDYLLLTDSCDSHGREIGLPHCGVCSSCLLRRVSLINSIGHDDKIYGKQTKSREEKLKKFECYKNLILPLNKYGSCYVKAHEVSDNNALFEERITLLYETYRKEVELALPQIIDNENLTDKWS